MRILLQSAVMIIACATVATAQIHFTARLDGLQQNPPVVVPATGTGSFTLSSDLSRLAWTISYQGLSGTLSAGGHFHVADSGRNGPVVKNIATSGDPVSNTISGVWTSTDLTQPLTMALVESLLTGRSYVNFHTSANPAGEIRGQVNLATAVHFTANLDGAQQNPPVTTSARGTGAFVLNPARTEIRWYITYRNLSGTLSAGGHFHIADSGRNGPVVKNIASGGDPAFATINGVWSTTDATQPLTRAHVDSLFARKSYVNFHTSANPSGEVRGQLVLQGGTGFVARLNGAQQNPPVTTSGSGTGSFSLNGARTELKYNITYINLSGTLSAGGHFHAGDSGRNGPVVRNVGTSGDPASNTVSGVWRSTDSQSLTAALVESLLTGRSYVNFHTSTNPGGEVRGQVSMTTGIGFTSKADGAQQNPPVTTNGKGTGSIVLNAARNQITYHLTYHGLSGVLSGAGGHFHVARVGVNGPIVRNIAPGGLAAAATVSGVWSSTDVTQTLTRALVDSAIAGKLYANFHTGANPGGEIRGQLRFGTESLTGVRINPGGIPESFQLEQNYPNPFNPVTTIRFNITKGSHVRLTVYDILGREVSTVVHEFMMPGGYIVEFDAGQLSSGVYFYRLHTGAFTEAKKMMLMR